MSVGRANKLCATPNVQHHYGLTVYLQLITQTRSQRTYK